MLAGQRTPVEHRHRTRHRRLRLGRFALHTSQMVQPPRLQEAPTRERVELSRAVSRIVPGIFPVDDHLPSLCVRLCHTASIVGKTARVNTRPLPRAPAAAPNSSKPTAILAITTRRPSEAPTSRAIKKRLQRGPRCQRFAWGRSLARTRLRGWRNLRRASSVVIRRVPVRIVPGWIVASPSPASRSATHSCGHQIKLDTANPAGLIDSLSSRADPPGARRIAVAVELKSRHVVVSAHATGNRQALVGLHVLDLVHAAAGHIADPPAA